MIKRRFYRDEHADKNGASSDSSSSSDSEVEPEASEDSEGGEYDDDAVAEEKVIQEQSCSTSSGYESGDSSNEIDGDSPGFISDRQEEVDPQLSNKRGGEILQKEFFNKAEDEADAVDMPDCVLQFKTVFKCRICPRIVCLTEEMMKTHLSSKRHSRSEKLLKENRLKVMLNSDGEIENQETPAEMHARILALAQDKPKTKNKGRQRQRNRSIKKQKVGDNSNLEKANGSTKNPPKKRRKREMKK